MDLNKYCEWAHHVNHKWWHDEDGNLVERNKGELIALMHSELSEALEGERKQLMDDKLPDRFMTEVEMADCVIRIMDYCYAFNYDLQGAVRAKLEFNVTRQDHSREARAQPHGKKF